MSHDVALLSIKESAEIFGITRRTIERKIQSGDISDTQIVSHGRETKIYVNELVRVFGEPKIPENKEQKQSVAAQRINMRHRATSAKNVAYQVDPRDAHIATLVEQLERGRERERELKERADRYERECSELRHVTEALKQKLLEAPRPSGLFTRLFGR
jgi:dTDP-4-amino-4,6-dideoxygalactose transaminase